LLTVLAAIAEASGALRLLFPAHPRTAKALESAGALPAGCIVLPPLPYLEFNWLVQHARVVVTDSGGVTEETTVLGIPCMTLRDSTERPETVEVGSNELLGTDPSAIGPAFQRIFGGTWKRGSIPELWDGKASIRIAAVLERIVGTAEARSTRLR
jgi:UDP-N-acetylglucosamine 2-epimerase (non-hydrolysing)